jgi:dTDP-4-dehydrorhamnose 3,5-epimerase-like enzyme
MSREAIDMEHGGRFHIDDRGTRYCSIFPEIAKGDINVTVVEPGCTALWHRHRLQSDYQFVVKGALKIGMCNLPNTKYSAVDMNDEEVFRLDNAMDLMVGDWKTKYRSLTMDALISRHDKFDSDKDWVLEYEDLWPVDQAKVEWHYLSERNANEGPLYIPPGLWHGCHNYTNEQAILVYHITNKWDGNDEDRCDVDTMKWSVEREAK